MSRILSAALLSVLVIAGFTTQPRHAEAGDLPARASGFVNTMGLDVVALMADTTMSKARKLDRFHAVFKQNFDEQTMSRFALGRYQSAATPAQQLECARLMEDMMVRSYFAHFESYGGGSFTIIAARADSDHDAMVMTEVKPFGGKPVEVEWRVRERGNRLGIIDVAIEGVSMSVAQRQEFSSVILANGGNIDVFLQILRDHNTRLASSAP